MPFSAFDYLENRLTGQCQAQFDCTHSYAICRVLRLFDPSYVAREPQSVDLPSSFLLQWSEVGGC